MRVIYKLPKYCNNYVVVISESIEKEVDYIRIA